MSSKSVVAFRHVHFEDLGHFAPVLERYGYDLTYCDVGIDPLESLNPLAADLLIVLGGPISAYEEEQYPFLHEELAFLTSRLVANRPEGTAATRILYFRSMAWETRNPK